MNTRRLEESTRLIGATRWGAIAAGVFAALALQIILLLFGVAIGTSVGNERLETGYSIWAVIVQLGSIALGAALAASLSHPADRMGGIAAGVMTWAVAFVLGGMLTGLTLTRLATDAAWTAFFGAILGLGAAIIGGSFGARFGGTTGARRTQEPLATDLTGQPLGHAT